MFSSFFTQLERDAVPGWLPGFHRQGYAVVPDAVPTGEIDALVDALGEEPALQFAAGTYAVREVCDTIPEFRRFLRSAPIRRLVEPVLGASARPVKATLYDKTPETNWQIAWHQDVAIAVRERREVAGFTWWTERAGVPHVQPPAGIRSEMLAVRLHLDPCGPEDGPLLLVPGSHREGRLPPERALQIIRQGEPVTCCLPRGAALLMRPLLLHASGPALRPSRRRVLHVEFAAGPLPGGLQWQMDEGLSASWEGR